MKSIWLCRITFKPSGPLTFRKMPSGILHIMSYPFMPPTTMSGFLARLLLVSEGNDWPGYGIDWFNGVEIENDSGANGAKPGKKGKGKKKSAKIKAGCEYTLTLDKNLRALGAFPDGKKWRIHKTRRHGPKDFKHSEFSELHRTSHKANYQLHHWDYLFCDELTGFVAANARAPLERLLGIKNFGGKAGKEGYLTVVSVEEPREVAVSKGKYIPFGLVPNPARPSSGTYYNTYSHHWSNDYLWSDGSQGGVVGYTQSGAWWNVESIEGEYWELDEVTGIPAHAPDSFLIGEREKFWEGSDE